MADGASAHWIERAKTVATELAMLGADPDDAGPRAAVDLLRRTGLVTLLGPVEHGGAGQGWATAHRVVRLVSAADGAIGRALAYHYVWVWLAPFIGTEEKIQHIGEVAARAQWFFGGAAHVREATLDVTDDGDMMIFDGLISPAVGSGVSDITILEGFLPGSDVPISALAMSSEDGLTCLRDDRDWAADSGTITSVRTAIPWTGALGHVHKRFQPRPYNDFIHPTLQLVLADVLLGIARGALTACVARALPPGDVRRELTDKLRMADSLANLTADYAGALHADHDDVSHDDLDEYESKVAAMRELAVDAAGTVLRSAELPSMRLGRFCRDFRTVIEQSPGYETYREAGDHLWS